MKSGQECRKSSKLTFVDGMTLGCCLVVQSVSNLLLVHKSSVIPAIGSLLYS